MTSKSVITAKNYKKGAKRSLNILDCSNSEIEESDLENGR